MNYDCASRIMGFAGYYCAPPLCFYCGTQKKGLKLCARCHKADYCSRECQKKHWKKHKKVCKKK